MVCEKPVRPGLPKGKSSKPAMRALAGILGFVLALSSSLFVANSAQASSQSVQRPEYLIKIIPGSTLRLVAAEGLMPIAIKNGYDEPIRVQIHIRPSNLRAVVPSVVEVTVPAATTSVAKVTVRGVADGDVSLEAWLTTFSGLRLGPAVQLKMVVNAEVETTLMIAFACFVFALLVVGVIRTRRKKRAMLEPR
jgi:hypothetical protein